MKFHMGVSFSWRTIKKFIIPILLGALAYFGFSGIFDNFNIPLGFIKVNALENYDTNYYIDFPDRHFFDLPIDNNNVTFTEFVQHLTTIESEYYNIIVSPSVELTATNNYLYGFIIFTIPKSYSFLNFSFFGQSTYFSYRCISISSLYSYNFNLYNDNPVDIYNYSVYQNLMDCLTNNSCKGRQNYYNSNFTYGGFNLTTSNDTNSNVYLYSTKPNFNSSSYLFPNFIYYSSVPIVYDNTYNTSNNSYFYKTLVFNNNKVEVGDYIPTYYDYLQSLPPEEDYPSEEETIHKKLFNKIFWFDDSNTEKGILSSLYILLFFYCLSMILFKIATLLKNKRW